MSDSGHSLSGTDRFRKQGPKPHPDWFWLTSGGVDSVAAYLLTKDALHENYQKRPLLVYLDTRVGLPFQRMYVEELADRYDEQLWTLRTHEKFEDRVASRGKFADRDDSGAPGAALHSDVQNELKGRQRDKLSDLCDGKPLYITGIRAGESPARASKPKGEEKRKARYVKPVYGLSKEDCARIILRHEDCPINPAWTWNHFTDCGCGSNGDPSEYDKVAERFPWFAQRMREYEEAAEADGLRGTLGWDGLAAHEKSARRDGYEQMTLCGEGCQRKRAPAIVRAFRARIHGATPEEAIAILDGEKPTSADLVAATDGGKPCNTETGPDHSGGGE